MIAYARAVSDTDWPLNEEGIVYVIAAEHSNFARALLIYLKTIKRLQSDIIAHFRNGKHVMRHMEGHWNGIWSDIFIESTFMRYGHGPAGIVGVTLKDRNPETMGSLPLCVQSVNGGVGWHER